MPLTKKGKQVLRNFIEKYGSDKGETYFYSYINKNRDRTVSWHKRR